MVKLDSRTDSTLGRVLFDKVYGPNKEILVEERKISDSLNFERYEQVGYNVKGEVLCIKRYIDKDYSSEYPYETIKRNAEGKLEVEEADYRQFFNRNENKSLTQPYLVRIDKTVRKGIISYDYRIASFEKVPFVKVKSLQDDFSVDFKITNDNVNEFAFQNIVQFGDAKIVLYSRRDTATANEWRDFSLTGAMKRALRTKGKFARDSVKFYYKDKLFSGEVRLFFGTGERLVHVKGGKMAVDLMAIKMVNKDFGDMSENRKKLLKSYVDLTFKKGDITFISVDVQESREHVTAQAHLKNSALHGKFLAQLEKVNYEGETRKKERVEMEFYEGLPHGIMKEERWDKEAKQWEIKKLEHYHHGKKSYTNYIYERGRLEEVRIYTKDGLKTGEWKKFEFNGKVHSVTNYKDGKLNGLSYKFGYMGDTIEFGNYINGKREGVFRQTSNDNTNEKYTLQGFYKDGKLQGSLVLKDANGVVRMKAEVKNDIIQSSDIYISNFIKTWMSDLRCEPKYEFYYANGVKYCEGQTVIDSFYLKEQNYYDAYNYSSVIDSTKPAEDAEDAYAEAAEDYVATSDDLASVTQINYDGMIKTGVWKYYYPDGALRYKITYIDSNKVKVGKDTIYGCAEYLEYFNDGQLMAKGMVLQEGFVQECESDLFEVDYKVLYTDFYNAAGKPIMKNSTGTIIKYFSNQMVHEEGKYINGKKDGWWKEYNREGKLIFVGRYVNGLPDGRHLRGDLEGINYLDDRCFENMQKEQEAIEESQYYNFKRAGDSGALQNLEMR